MSVVIISGESHCRREEIAREVAEALGYVCISREVLAEASRRYSLPEEKLEEALKDSSSFLDRLSNTRSRHLAYFQAALTAALNKDNVVYHGEAGHMFVSEVSHVLGVRLMADLEERVAIQDGERGNAREEGPRASPEGERATKEMVPFRIRTRRDGLGTIRPGDQRYTDRP